MNVILILMDSLNRDYLSCYGNDWIQTPNIQRLADRGHVFDRHFIGSAPCIPARRDLFSGRREFLWRGWGQTEPFDRLLPAMAAQAGAFPAMITDHYHYWDGGDGYGYMNDFAYVDMIRGAENDSAGDADTSRMPLPPWVETITRHRPRAGVEGFYRNVIDMRDEMDFQSPRVMASAASWLAKNAARDKFFLHIESFDPHEPFHAPEPYRSMYGPYDESLSCWPPYQNKEAAKAYAEGHLPGEPDFVRAQYAGKLTMADRHLGRVLDALDAQNLWDNTAVILTTDHGYELFEHGRYGKSYPHMHTSANIPLVIWHPNLPGRGARVSALTTTTDLYATVLDLLGHPDPTGPDSRSLLPCLQSPGRAHRDHVTFGVFGTGAGFYDGEHTFYTGFDNRLPLYWYSTHMPRAAVGAPGTVIHRELATGGRFIPGVDCPVWRIPCDGKDAMPPMLFDAADTAQRHDIAAERPDLVQAYRAKAVEWLTRDGVPPEQYARLLLS